MRATRVTCARSSAASKTNPQKAAHSAPAPSLVLASRLANTNRVPLSLKPVPKIVRQEVNGHRFYKVDGYNELFPSVTTVLGAFVLVPFADLKMIDIVGKPALYSWERKMFSSSLKTALLNELTEEAWLKRATAVQKEAWIEKILSQAQTAPTAEKDYASDFGSNAHNTFDVLLKVHCRLLCGCIEIDLFCYREASRPSPRRSAPLRRASTSL